MTDSPAVNISVFCTFTLEAVRTSNNQQTCKISVKKEEVLCNCKWLTEYLTEWFTVLRLCTFPKDNHVCSLSCRLTYSFSLPPAFVCHPHHPLCLLFCSPTEKHPLSLCPHLSVTFITHFEWFTPHCPWCFNLPLKACPDFLLSAYFTSLTVISYFSAALAVWNKRSVSWSSTCVFPI